MLEIDYPYVGVDGASCLTDESKYAAKVSGWGQITTSIEDIQAMLQERPLSAAVNASHESFRFYKDGVMDGTCLNLSTMEDEPCSTNINHAITIVGYSEGGEQVITEEKEVYVCEIYYVYWLICTWKTVTEETVVSDGPAYWKVQNSWGTGWGMDGFFLVEIQGARGVNGINQYVQFVEPDMTFTGN